MLNGFHVKSTKQQTRGGFKPTARRRRVRFSGLQRVEAGASGRGLRLNAARRGFSPTGAPMQRPVAAYGSHGVVRSCYSVVFSGAADAGVFKPGRSCRPDRRLNLHLFAQPRREKPRSLRNLRCIFRNLRCIFQNLRRRFAEIRCIFQKLRRRFAGIAMNIFRFSR
jgi:hypothetical protein